MAAQTQRTEPHLAWNERWGWSETLLKESFQGEGFCSFLLSYQPGIDRIMFTRSDPPVPLTFIPLSELSSIFEDDLCDRAKTFLTSGNPNDVLAILGSDSLAREFIIKDLILACEQTQRFMAQGGIHQAQQSALRIATVYATRFDSFILQPTMLHHGVDAPT